MEMIRDYANDSLDIWMPVRKMRIGNEQRDVLLSTNTSINKATGAVAERITVTFYGKAKDFISRFARIKLSQLSKSGDKLYFALYVTDDSGLGYKISNKKEKSIRICAAADEYDYNLISKYYKGHYDLEFDEQLQLYYINLNSKRG